MNIGISVKLPISPYLFKQSIASPRATNPCRKNFDIFQTNPIRLKMLFLHLLRGENRKQSVFHIHYFD